MKVAKAPAAMAFGPDRSRRAFLPGGRFL